MLKDLSKYIIDDRIFSVKFKCELNKCKGGCCTMYSDLGAPILESEIAEIRNHLPLVKENLPDKNLEVLENEGFFLEYENKFYLNNIKQRDCVFSVRENNIAKCIFEKLYFLNKIKFRKPISCQLFPIRISGNDREVLRYEYFTECSDAIINGEKNDISVFEFTKDALVREFGNETYNEIKESHLKKC
ncbi:MAG TPA: DUF3109 family protein [Ignavibacteria bacterium]|nr:DUF3109 family protein [Ignavibacteria bacterium]